jgi:hypothetical protein
VLIRDHAPNQVICTVTLADAHYNLVPNFPPTRYYAKAVIRSIATGGGDGASFQFLTNQASAPADGTKGKMVSATGQNEQLPGGAHNCWVKGTSTDVIEIEVWW